MLYALTSVNAESGKMQERWAFSGSISLSAGTSGSGSSAVYPDVYCDAVFDKSCNIVYDKKYIDARVRR